MGNHARNSAELEFGLTGVLMTTTPPHDQPAPPGWCRIDPGLGLAATRVPAASRENSRPQAILKFQPCNSFDYRVRYEPQLNPSHQSMYRIRGNRTPLSIRTPLSLEH